MFQFYKEIISPGDAERKEIAEANENLGLEVRNTLKPLQEIEEGLRSKPEIEAVTAVSDKLSTAIISRTRAKRDQMNFEPELLLIYFAKFTSVIGLEEGSDLARVEAINTISDIFDSLKESVAKAPPPKEGEKPNPEIWENWNIGQLGFFKRKRKKYRHDKTINSLFLFLDSRLQAAMATVNTKIYKLSIYKLPEKTSKFIQQRAASDARIILKSFKTKKNRIGMLKSILQRIIKPLAKNILSIFGVFNKKIHGMIFAQLADLQTFFVETAKELDARLTKGFQKSKPHAAGMRFSRKAPSQKTNILQLTYDPETQRGLILRLRSRLGDHFELRFKPIGNNGDEEEEEEEEEESFPILSLPAELVFYITSFMVKMNPTKAELKGLLDFARSDPAFRLFLENPFLERMVSQKFLGAFHSRTPAERRLGLEPNVAERYRGVLQLLGSAINVSALQDMADRNAKIYKEEGLAAYSGFIVSERPETREEGKKPRKKIKKQRHISSWPWWYFRLLANRKSLVSMTNHFSSKSDPFSASVVSVKVLKPAFSSRGFSKKFKPRILSDATPKASMYGPRGNFLLLPLGRHAVEDAEKWEIWTSGADLIVIPMDKLIQRAGGYGMAAAGYNMELEGPIHLTISVSEPMRLDIPREGRASFRKEVAITGLKKISKTIRTHLHHPGISEPIIKNFNVNLSLQIQHAYLGKQWTQFLGHKEGARSFLRLEHLKIQHVHFEDLIPLDLSGITGDQLVGLHFGPSNMSHVPKLSCPSSSLRRLGLETKDIQNRILLWDLPDPTTCFPELISLYIAGNVKIWESPLLEKLSKFPNLKTITLRDFSGNEADLFRLGGVLEQAPQSKTTKGIVVKVQFSWNYMTWAIFEVAFEGVHFSQNFL